jgi:glycerophosphoryl diester phosphodiesterase
MNTLNSRENGKTGKNQKNLPDGWPVYIAHRGASTLAPENSLSSFSRARELGCRGIEFDVHLCKSGELVVTHDDWLDRIAGVHKRIEDMSYAEIREIDTGSFFNTKFPASANASFSAERIPTLDVVLETAGADMFMDIELKTDSLACADLARETARVLERHNKKNCIISSFMPLAILAYRKYGDHAVAAIYCAYKTVPFILRHRECLYLSHADIKKPSLETAFRSPGYETGTKPVMVWTVDTAEEAKRLLDGGVDSIITNRIQDFMN